MDYSLNSLLELPTTGKREAIPILAALVARQTKPPRLTPLEWATTNATIVHPVRGRVVFVPYPYQARFLEDTARLRLVLKARQIGYSQVFALDALYKAISFSERTILLISRSQDLAVNLLRYCYQTYNGLQDAPTLIKENESEMGFSNGSRIKSIPANRSTGRGFAASDVYLDEFAYAMFADSIYQSVFPAIAQGGGLTIGSTPNGRGNLFNRLWVTENKFSKTRIDWRECPAYWTDEEKARGIPAEESGWYQANRAHYTNAAWAAEFDCDFSTSGGAVFRRVRELSTLLPREKCETGNIVAGLDFAQINDYTVLSVIDEDTREQIFIDRFNKMEWATARGRIAAAVDRFHIRNIIAERNSIGSPLIEQMQQDGLPVTAFDTTAQSKDALIRSLTLAFEQNEIKLLADETQINELESFAMTVSAQTGRASYSASTGAHDDMVMALALAWHGAQSPVWIIHGVA